MNHFKCLRPDLHPGCAQASCFQCCPYCLQAMDRAHRLGQKRTVNVYRLLTRNTLEEKIMSLQRFKLDVAGTVVNQDNMSMQSMDKGRLLDLFSQPGGVQPPRDAGDSAAAGASRREQLILTCSSLQKLHTAECCMSPLGDRQRRAPILHELLNHLVRCTGDVATKSGKKASTRSVLEGLQDLWDEDQYAEEFNVREFSNKIGRTKQ